MSADYLEMSGEELRAFGQLPAPAKAEPKTLRKLDIPTPALLLAIYDPVIREQQMVLHPWQIEVSDTFAEKYTNENPLRFCLVAANGSGKDAFVVTPFAVWFTLTKIRSRCIVTSASGTQLSSQTESLIRSLCEKVNQFHVEKGDEPPFRINQRDIRCNLSGSEIRFFATDEAGKAEGYHPFPDYTGAEMAIIVNEAKSVSEEIFSALSRCTGGNYTIYVSTPGGHTGRFYYAATNWKNVRTVTAFDCPHITKSEIEEAKQADGENSALYKSKILAQFTAVDGTYVLPIHLYESCNAAPSYEKWPLRVGVDLAAGGDECVIYVTRGNATLAKKAWRDRDTTVSKKVIVDFLRQLGINQKHEHLYFDDGGLGKAVIDTLVREGWNITRILNGYPARRKKDYANIGTENWFNVSRLFQMGIWSVDENDTKLKKQLTSRTYKRSDTNDRYILHSKQEMRSHGLESPDHADAFVLSLYGLTVDDYINDSFDPMASKLKPRTTLTMEQLTVKKDDFGRVVSDPIAEDALLEQLYPGTYGRNPAGMERSTDKQKRRSFFSLASIMKR